MNKHRILENVDVVSTAVAATFIGITLVQGIHNTRLKYRLAHSEAKFDWLLRVFDHTLHQMDADQLDSVRDYVKADLEFVEIISNF